jgi:hypothetical protein
VNSSPNDSFARTSMRCRNSLYFGGVLYAAIGNRWRSAGRCDRKLRLYGGALSLVMIKSNRLLSRTYSRTSLCADPDFLSWRATPGEPEWRIRKQSSTEVRLDAAVADMPIR